MKLIDADALNKEYYKNPTYLNLCKALNNAPIIDAEIVVRCGNCKWRGNPSSCPDQDGMMGNEGFCAWGERRD